MSNHAEHQFVSTSTEQLVSQMITAYEKITGVTVRPASPEMLFVRWVADVILQTRVLINYAANQNLPSRASGTNLDYLGELFYDSTRPEAAAATCRIRVNISEAQASAILVPKGTRFTDLGNNLYWDSVEDAYIPAGEISTEVQLICETAGSVGNGYMPGQINTLVDISDVLYYSSCENVTMSDGGAEAATDEEYYELMRASEDAYSVAGPMGAYEYWAKSVSTEIADVKAVRPSELRQSTLPVYASHAFIGGEHLFVETFKVFLPDGSEAAMGVDYTAEYEDNLLVISLLEGGGLADATTIAVEYIAEMAGHVYIYVLMEDGTIASTTIKELVEAACSDETVRPLTDYVSIQDPGETKYNVDVTYYIQRGIETPASEIEAAVVAAVNAYTAWQGSKLGRDINPSKLHDLLMDTGIKRVVITEPLFTPLADGNDGSVPQVATVNTVNIVNGGYEDE